MPSKKAFTILSAALIAAGISVGSAEARMHHNTEDARQILREIELNAGDVEDQADQLIHVSENLNLSPNSHLERLDAMKKDVNRMGSEMSVLEAERDTLPLWEQTAIDEMQPVLKDAAQNTEA